MKNNKNEVQIFGVIMDIQPGTFFKDGEKFGRFYIGAKRTSGNVDLLPVIVKEKQTEGYLCKPPVYRRTPRGKEICDLMIACNEYDLRRTDYIPCVAWWTEAREAANFKVGDYVSIIGRIQSRIYQKKLSGDEIELRTAYEVSVRG